MIVLGLRMLYVLLNKTVDGIPPLLELLGSYIKTEGLNTMRNNAETIVEDSEKYVEQLLEMYTKFSALVGEAFNNDARFLTVRDQAFQHVVNNTEIFHIEVKNAKKKGNVVTQPESKCPELLAIYCDLLLRKSPLTKKLPSEEIDRRLDNVVSLKSFQTSLILSNLVARFEICREQRRFHALPQNPFESSSYFGAFCRSRQRRKYCQQVQSKPKFSIIHNLCKFQEQGMPSDFVTKLTRMLQDVELNKDLTNNFKESVTSQEHRAIAGIKKTVIH